MEEELVEVYAASVMEAEIVRGMLEENGIEAIVQSGQSGMYPVSVGAMGEGRVLVHADDADDARELIRSSGDSPAGKTE